MPNLQGSCFQSLRLLSAYIGYPKSLGTRTVPGTRHGCGRGFTPCFSRLQVIEPRTLQAVSSLTLLLFIPVLAPFSPCFFFSFSFCFAFLLFALLCFSGWLVCFFVYLVAFTCCMFHLFCYGHYFFGSHQEAHWVNNLLSCWSSLPRVSDPKLVSSVK